MWQNLNLTSVRFINVFQCVATFNHIQIEIVVQWIVYNTILTYSSDRVTNTSN